MATKEDTHRKRVVVEEIKEGEEKTEQKAEVPAKTQEVPVEEAKEETLKEEEKAKGPEPVEGEAPKEEKKEEKKEEEVKQKPEPPKEVEEKKSLWYIFWIMIPVAIIVGALAGGVFYFLNSVNKNSPSSTPTPAASSGATPTSSPSAQVDLSKYQIKVLNGSGIAGEAGKVQDLLTSAGFKVSGTGNAASYDYTDTVVQISSNVESEFSTKLMETLAKTYSVKSETESIPAGQSGDVIVIVGTSKASQ